MLNIKSISYCSKVMAKVKGFFATDSQSHRQTGQKLDVPNSILGAYKVFDALRRAYNRNIHKISGSHYRF